MSLELFPPRCPHLSHQMHRRFPQGCPVELQVQTLLQNQQPPPASLRANHQGSPRLFQALRRRMFLCLLLLDSLREFLQANPHEFRLESHLDNPQGFHLDNPPLPRVSHLDSPLGCPHAQQVSPQASLQVNPRDSPLGLPHVLPVLLPVCPHVRQVSHLVSPPAPPARPQPLPPVRPPATTPSRSQPVSRTPP